MLYRVASGESMKNSRQSLEFVALCFVCKTKGLVKLVMVNTISKVKLYLISKLQGLGFNAL